MTQLLHKTRILAAKLGVPLNEVTLITRLPLEEMRKVFKTMCRAAELMLETKPISKHSPETTNDSSKQSCFVQLREKLTVEIVRRRAAEKKLKAARTNLYNEMGEERAERKKLKAEIPSSVRDASKPRLVWNETDFEEWIHREIDPEPRLLFPSSTNMTLEKAKSAPKERRSSGGGDSNYLKYRVLDNRTIKFRCQMHKAAIPGSTISKKSSQDDLSKKRSKVNGYRIVKRHLAGKGREDQVESLERQKETMERRDFSTRLSVVAKECLTELNGFNRHMLENSWALKRRLKKRARDSKRWRETRTDDKPGQFPGLAAGRPSPLRTSTSLDDLKDEIVDESGGEEQTEEGSPWDD
ncbi:hypothetical protein F5B19DRAFT_110258 [Rostrohypoxylon terebratum]|nr:hypothetical protein F5B19DRAFT_110258 [Rostrohypoxylon terebratum]